MWPNLLLIPFLFWLAIGQSNVEAAREIIAAHQAQDFVDQKVVVQGRVTAARKDGRNTFLVLGSPSQSELPDLTIALTPPLLLSGFPDDPEAFYPGKTVQVRGTVYLFQGTPEILVRHASFIKVVKEKRADKNAEIDQQNDQKDEAEEEGAQTLSIDVSNANAARLGLPFSTTPILPQELTTGKNGAVLDMRTAQTEGTGLETSACGEAQGLWQQVSQDLIPHLRTYTGCLEKGSLGCDSEGEKVALGMLGVQQAQKRIRIMCQ